MAALLMGPLAAGPLAAQDGWADDWSGTLAAGGAQLRLVLHLAPGGTGASGLAATLDSPDQGAFGIPATDVATAGDSLTVTFANIGGGYVGARNAAGDTLSGTWSQGGQAFPLVLTRGPGEQVNRPQEPEPPFPYVSEDVTFASSDGRVVLAGTLTLPDGAGPHPAAVLVSGSGPQNRDEEVFGHRPFLVLADYLARRGVAVLRYDDRGFGESTGDFTTATSENFARDAEAGLRYLLTRNEINPAALGIIGHSEGGLVAQVVASRSSNVAWIVMLAGPGVRGDSLLVMQADAINRAAEVP
jgi:pimeloyl-ACP methyl ester carboxylesterase